MLDLGTMVAKIQLDNKDANKGLDEFGDKSTSKAAMFKKAFLAVSAVAVACGVAIKKLADQTAKYGDQIDKESQKMNISRKGYQEWGYVLERNGASINSLKVGMKTLTSQMEKGSKAFDTLNVKTKNADGTFRDTEDVLNETMSALAGVKDATERSALANEIFGKRTASELLPTLNSGADGIDALKNRAEELGFVMSDEAVKACADYSDAMTDIQMSATGLKNNIMSALMPTLAQFAFKVSDAIGRMSVTIHQEVEKNGAAGIVIAIGKVAVKAAKAIISAVPKLIEGLAKVIDKLADSLSEGNNGKKMVEGAVKMIAKLAVGIIKATPKLISAVAKLIASFVGQLKKVNLTSIGRQIISSLLQGFKNMWGSITGWVSDKVNWIKEKFSSAKKSASSGTGHRIGLREVPYDGYQAVLHKGETVLTASETNQLQSVLNGMTSAMLSGMASANSMSGGSQTIHLQVDLGGAKVAEQIYKLSKQGKMTLVGGA